jgi:acetolactate synthase I/III small subunit
MKKELKKEEKEYLVIEIEVNNHPGVMSHITGLFFRRGFNLEGINCSRIGNGEKSKMYLLVENNEKIEQIRYQLEKLYDVLGVEVGVVIPESKIEKFNKLKFLNSRKK